MKSPLPPHTLAAFAGDQFRARIFYDKYAARNADNHQIETLPSQMWDRIAREIANAEPDEPRRTQWMQYFRWLLEDYRTIPSRRITVGAGNPRHLTLATCCIHPSPLNIIGFSPDTPHESHRYSPLATVNLAAFVQDPFTPRADILTPELMQAVSYTVRFLDDVLDYTADRHTLLAQREISLNSRRIGVGLTGLADLFIQLGIRFDTDAALQLANNLFREIKHVAYGTSLALAREKGPFPLFQSDRHFDSPFFHDFPSELLDMLRKDGLRNTALLTVPAVGSGAALAGVTPGIEPVFAFQNTRRSESPPHAEFTEQHPLVTRYREITNRKESDPLPENFITASEILPEARIALHATLQKHIDQDITSTLYVPREMSPDAIAQIYRIAWDAGCKGIIVHRQGLKDRILVTETKATTPIDTAKSTLINEINRLIDAKMLPGRATLSAAPTADDLAQLTQAVDHVLRNGPPPLTLSPDSRRLHPPPSVSVGPTLVQATPEGNPQVTVALVLTIHG